MLNRDSLPRLSSILSPGNTAFVGARFITPRLEISQKDDPFPIRYFRDRLTRTPVLLVRQHLPGYSRFLLERQHLS
jgi:hypothetical protein